MKSTIRRATAKQPAAILALIRLVDATIKAIPQNDEPRSGCKESVIYKDTYICAIIKKKKATVIIK